MKDPGEPVATIVTEYVPAVVELRVQADETLALAEIVTATLPLNPICLRGFAQ